MSSSARENAVWHGVATPSDTLCNELLARPGEGGRHLMQSRKHSVAGLSEAGIGPGHESVDFSLVLLESASLPSLHQLLHPPPSVLSLPHSFCLLTL